MGNRITIIEKFRQCIIDLGKARSEGKSREADRKEHKVHLVFDDVVSQGRVGREAILRLVDDDIELVRLYAASFSLYFAPDKCVEALRKIEREGDLILYASSILKYWALGTWNFGRLDGQTLEEPEPDPLSLSEAPTSSSVSGSLGELIKAPPTTVKLAAIAGQHRIHERVSLANLCCDGCIEYPDDNLAFMPDVPFPPKNHILAWIWSIRPDLGRDIAAIAGSKLSKLITEYIEAGEYVSDDEE